MADVVVLHALQLRRGRIKARWYWVVNRIALCQFATLSFCIAGILLIRGDPHAMYWLIPVSHFVRFGDEQRLGAADRNSPLAYL